MERLFSQRETSKERDGKYMVRKTSRRGEVRETPFVSGLGRTLEKLVLQKILSMCFLI